MIPPAPFAASPFGLLRLLDAIPNCFADFDHKLAGPDRVNRGGSGYRGARYCRSANRGNFDPGSRNSGLGFRLARSLAP